MFVVVPNELHDLIHARIVSALVGRPCTDTDRETLYSELLNYFNVHGLLPDFSLKGSL